MFFATSKLFWFVFAPSHLIVWSIVAAAVLLFLERQRAARWCAAAAALLAIGFGILPFGVWIMQPIENQYPRPGWPAHVEGILVLGGGLDSEILQSRGVITSDGATSRLVSILEIARRYPTARIVFSGGDGTGGRNSEALVAKHILLASGLAPDRLSLEAKSRNTWENFVFAKRIAKPRPGDVWLLATSAYHLPRAMRIAQRVGWPMVPWPTDYTTARTTHYDFRDIPANLKRTDLAVHEWLGLLAYRLSAKA